MYMWKWLTSLSLLTTVALASSLAEQCGSGDIIKQSTIQAGGQSLAVTTTRCPNLGAAHSTLPNLATNDPVAQCSKSDNACAVSCNSTAPQPQQLDCDALTVALNHLDYDSFTAAPMTLTKYSLRTCSFTYINYDNATSYEPCIIQYSMQALATTLACRVASSPGLTGNCVSPGGANNTWTIEVTQT
ncbi:hypothetical protein H0H92_010216 [Tricholoma furcatifolium]|nr:hypothetical protein H0H92_010216 [Tricholoma furcatifolium]